MNRPAVRLIAQLGPRQAARTMVLVSVAGALTALLDVQVLRSRAELHATVRQQVSLIATVEPSAFRHDRSVMLLSIPAAATYALLLW